MNFDLMLASLALFVLGYTIGRFHEFVRRYEADVDAWRARHGEPRDGESL